MTGLVDFAFVFDATGSMENTIQAVQAKIVTIATQLQNQYSNGFSFQYGAIAYRDKIDDGSVTMSCPFNPNPQVMRSWLTTVQAKGGGDICEDWVDATEQLFNLKWRDNALRCVFWIADSPAHGFVLLPHEPLTILFLAIRGVDYHPDQAVHLIPYIKKMAKMKMVFIGIDLCQASCAFTLMKQLYNAEGGPAFTIEKFKPETGNETSSIAELLEARAMTLVDQTVAQTCAFPIGRGCTMPITTSSAPTPPVTPGPDVSVPTNVQTILSRYGYRDISYIDKGVQGSVYAAIASSNSTPVAIKHMLFDTVDARKYFTREVTALRKLTHPAIISHIESRDLGQEAILVTRFEPKGTLEAFLKLYTPVNVNPEYQTKKTIIAFGIAFGMEFIHKQGYCHRDLKAANVFLNTNFEPVIGDFGLATDFSQSHDHIGPSMSIGTPLHMAPELWVDQSDGYGQSVDVYAYGVLLYTLFVPEGTCMNLLDDGRGSVRSSQTLLKRIGDGARFKRLPEIGDKYWELITAAWQTAPCSRPTFQQIVNAMITNLSGLIFPGANEAQVREFVERMRRYR
jgi:hypothetical protein